jgi:hypothetical protein
MKNENSCTSCDATNDPILSYCMFCNTALPESSIDTLKDEELFSNCLVWLSRYETLVENPDQLQVSMLKDNMYYASNIANSGFGKHTISFMTVSSSIERYLNMLEVKCSNSPALKNKIFEIRTRYNLAKSKLSHTKKQVNRRALYIGLGAVILLFVLFSIIFYMVSGEKDSIKQENERLEIIVQQINASVAEGKVDHMSRSSPLLTLAVCLFLLNSASDIFSFLYYFKQLLAIDALLGITRTNNVELGR